MRTYPNGTIIVNEGDEGNSMFLIHSGMVKAYLSDEKGKEVILSTQGPGEYFGELALFDVAPRSVSVAALEPCRMMVISRAALGETLKERPEIAMALLKGLAARVRALTENVCTLELQDVFGRLVATLYSLAKAIDDGLQMIDQKLTLQELASRIGAMRETVSRILRDLVCGYIEVKNKRITIRKKIPSIRRGLRASR